MNIIKDVKDEKHCLIFKAIEAIETCVDVRKLYNVHYFTASYLHPIKKSFKS